MYEHVPTSVSVIGGGTMGVGIAHQFASAGSRVVLVERDRASAEAASERLLDSLHRAASSGSGPEPVLPASDVVIDVTDDMAGIAASSLVIEAVPEDRAMKVAVLLAAQRAAPDAYLASNTSSLSIDDLAGELRLPGNFLGLHFFNPVPRSTLVEIVPGRSTSTDTLDLARVWVDSIGKTAVVVRGSPGFATSRLGVALAMEAIRMLQAGVASAEDIDLAMTLGYRHAMGPLRTTDVVGLDVRLAIAEHLAAELGPRFEPPQLLRELVAAGNLGRKAGRGFFNW